MGEKLLRHFAMAAVVIIGGHIPCFSDVSYPDLRGCVITSEEWPSYLPPSTGIYKVPVSDGQPFDRISLGANANGGGVKIGKTFYSCTYYDWGYKLTVSVNKYDTETWMRTDTKECSMGMIATDLALDPETDTVYGCFYKVNTDPNGIENPVGYEFGIADYPNASKTVISDLLIPMTGMAVGKDGTLYGLTKELVDGQPQTSKLVIIDKESGNVTEVGDTGVRPYFTGSACVDPESGRMFWTVSPPDGNSGLYEVDLNTGEATLITYFPYNEEVVALYVEEGPARPEAPAAVDNISLSFPEGALTGTVDFTIPSLTFSGTALEGNVEYLIKANNNEVARGSGDVSQQLSVPVEVMASGNYEFMVKLKNEHGWSPETSICAYIGHDTPVSPTGLNVSVNGRSVQLNWEAVNQGVNSGYVDSSQVRYCVTRMPDGFVVNEDLESTSVSDMLPESEGLAAYYYEIKAKYKEEESMPVTSRRIVCGHAETPYEENFDDYDKPLEFFTILNCNNDYNTWEINMAAASLSFPFSGGSDDWLISPAIFMEKGKEYVMTVDAWEYANRFGWSDRLEIKWGTEASVEGMRNVLLEPTVLSGEEDPRQYSFSIAPPETGLYHFGFHGMTENDGFMLLIDNLKISKGEYLPAPSEITDLKVEAYPDGEHKVSINAIAPVKDLKGDELTEPVKIIINRNDQLLDVIENVAPGNQVTYTDVDAPSGVVKYTVFASNQYGDTRGISSECFVGYSVPVELNSLKITERETPGVVDLSWDPVITDVDGRKFKEGDVTYILYEIDGNGVATELPVRLDGCAATLTVPVDGNDVAFARIGIKALSEGGETGLKEFEFIPVGGYNKLPYKESFAYAAPENVIAVQNIEEKDGEWMIYDEGSIPGYGSADSDGGYFAIRAKYINSVSRLLLGKFDFSDIESPALNFYTYNYRAYVSDGEEIPNNNEVSVVINDGAGYKKVSTTVMSELGAESWHEVLVDLSAYANKKVWLAFDVKTITIGLTSLDNISIDGNSGISDSQEECESVFAVHGELIIRTPRESRVQVNNLDSTYSKIFDCNGEVRIKLDNGIYIVNIGGNNYKIAVKS